MRLIPKGLIVITSALLLVQIEVGWFGLWINWGLLIILIVASFNLGYWGME